MQLQIHQITVIDLSLWIAFKVFLFGTEISEIIAHCYY